MRQVKKDLILIFIVEFERVLLQRSKGSIIVDDDQFLRLGGHRTAIGGHSHSIEINPGLQPLPVVLRQIPVHRIRTRLRPAIRSGPEPATAHVKHIYRDIHCTTCQAVADNERRTCGSRVLRHVYTVDGRRQRLDDIEGQLRGRTIVHRIPGAEEQSVWTGFQRWYIIISTATRIGAEVVGEVIIEVVGLIRIAVNDKF